MFVSILERFFCVTSKRSSFLTESKGGIVSFVSTAYLLLLIPHLINQSTNQSADHAVNQSSSQSVDGIAAVSICVIVSTLFSSIITNTPIVLVPGLGLTAFFAVTATNQSINQSIACSFLSSVLFSITSILGINSKLSQFIPRNLKIASMVGLGLFMSWTSLVMCGIASTNHSINQSITFGGLVDHPSTISIAFISFIVITSLMYHRVTGGMLIGIVIATVLYYLFEWQIPSINQWKWPNMLPMAISNQSTIQSISQSINLNSIWTIISFYFIQLFDVTTMIHTCSSRSYLSLNQSINQSTNQSSAHSFERKMNAIAGLTSMFSSFYGIPPMIIAVESVLSIKSGSKTGLSSFISCFLFLLCFPVASLLSVIPPIATASCSIVVGSYLVAECGRIPWFHPVSSLPSFVTIVLIPFTGSVAIGILAGYLTHVTLCITTNQSINQWRLEEEMLVDEEQVSDAELSDEEQSINQPHDQYGAISEEIFSPKKHEDQFD